MGIPAPYLGMENGKRIYGPRTVLCSTDVTRYELHQAYDLAVDGHQQAYTVSWLMKCYEQSDHVRKKLTVRTRKEYESYMSLISSFPTPDGLNLGAQPLKFIKRTTIRDYLDNYRNGSATISANHHVQFLKAAWNYVSERDDLVPPNPCLRVRLNQQSPRNRYVTDQDLQAYKNLCSYRSYMPLAMELAYLCRLRANEVYSLRTEHVLKDGLRIFRGKGSMGEITLWTLRLRKVVEDCQNWNKCIRGVSILSPWFLHDRKGCKYTMSNHKSQWARLQKAADAAGLERFNFHDLKAKGYTDQEIQDAGHMSQKMHKVYDRRGRMVRPPDGELPLD